MTKYLWAAALSFMLALGAWGWQGQEGAKKARADVALYQGRLQDSEAAVEALLTSAQKTETTLIARAKKAEARALTYKKEANALQAALNASREWADAPVPDVVMEALRGN